MLALAVESYLSVRRAAGFLLHDAGLDLKSFATYSDLQGQHHVRSTTAIDWARQASSRRQRARRLAHVARLARYLRAEDERHEIPPAVFGSVTSDALAIAAPIPGPIAGVVPTAAAAVMRGEGASKRPNPRAAG